MTFTWTSITQVAYRLLGCSVLACLHHMHCSPRKQPSGQITWKVARLLHADASASFHAFSVMSPCIALHTSSLQAIYIWQLLPIFSMLRLKLKVQGKSVDDFASNSFQVSFSSQRSGSFSTSKLGGASIGGSSATLVLDTSKWYTILQVGQANTPCI
eukprot:scaffold69746_cov20-Tisochrysis_lutea.AAC.1